MKVLRFTNVDLLKQPEAVVDAIYRHVVSSGARLLKTATSGSS
jgi:hypothetical protein